MKKRISVISTPADKAIQRGAREAVRISVTESGRHLIVRYDLPAKLKRR